MAKMEDELGVGLLRRTPRGVQLTPAGELVVAAAREITTRFDLLRAELDTMLDPESGTIRLAFLDSIATSIVPRALAAVHRDAPGLRVVLRQEPAHAIVEDLASGVVDLGITSPRPRGRVGWHPLQQERLVLVVPPGHRLRNRRRVRLTELAGEDLVTAPPSFGYQALVDGLLRESGVSPAVAFESQDVGAIEGLVSAGLGVAILPEPFAGLTGTKAIAIASDGAQRTIGLVWPTDRPLTSPAGRFRDILRAPVDRDLN
ncbi:LysR family transcriptional regulator [Nocardioides sp. CF8]|nr:LysR family transcriptional regulator [Nocardioides sp. CF8]